MPKRKPFRLQRYDITKRFSTVSGSTYFDTSDPNEHLILWARAANKDPVPLVAEDASTQDHTVTFFAGGGSYADGSKNQEARTTPFSEDSFANITSPVRFLKSADAYVKVADADDLSFGDGSSDSSFSLATWVLITSASATTGLIEKGLGTGAAPNEYRIFYHDGGLTGSISDVSASAELNFVADTAALFTENSWHHVAFTYNSAITKTARGRFYLNGNFVTGSCTETGTYVAMEPGSADLRLASNKDNQPVEFFEAAIWSGKVLTAEEINALYNAEGGLVDVAKDRVYIKTSGITSLPPRPYLHSIDNATGSYPTTYRLGDSRTGHYSASFNDTKAMRFHSFGGTGGLTGNVILGQQLPTYSQYTGSLVTNTNTVPDLNVTSSQTVVVPGISDSRVQMTPGDDYKPFIEDKLFAADKVASGELFYASGTSPSIVGAGFNGPLWSKTKIEIDLDPVNGANQKIFWSTGSVSQTDEHPSGIPVGSGLSYYNFDRKHWEMIGDLTTGSNVDYVARSLVTATGSLLVQVPASSPRSSLGSFSSDPSLQGIILKQEGFLTSFAGFPCASQFNATSSQLFDMSSKIRAPFLVEKIVYEFSASIPGPKGSNFTNTSAYFNFGILNHFENSTPLNSKVITRVADGTNKNASPSGTGTGADPDNYTLDGNLIPAPKHVTVLKDIVSSAVVSYMPELGTSGNATRLRDLNILFTSAIALTGSSSSSGVSGSFVLSMSANTPAFNRGATMMRTLNGARTLASVSRPTFFAWQGGRNGIADAIEGSQATSGRSLSRANVASNLSGSKFGILNFASSKSSGNMLALYDSIRQDTPYVLLPGDKLSFYWSNQSFPQSMSTDSEKNIARRVLQLKPGAGKIVMYGSMMREGKEFHQGLNQHLTSDAVHEDVQSSAADSTPYCLDQFDVDYETKFSGSYIDLAFEQIEGREFGVPASRIGFRPNSVLGGKAGTTGSIIRGLALIDTNERYQDSFFPDPVEIARVNEVSFVADDSGSPKFGSPRYVMYPLGPEVDAVLDAPADLRWPRAFPFESDYGALEFENRVSRASRVLNATNFSGVAVDSNSIFGDPVSTITGRNTSAQATNELFALMNIDGSGAGSPPVDARKLFLKSFFGIGDAVNGNPRIVKNVSDHAVSNFNGGNDVELRGFKYGLYNVVPAFTRAIYRRDRYGQFRDMLEQRALTAFEPFQYQIPNTRDLQGGEPQTVNTLEQPVTIQFKKTNSTGVGDELRIELLDSEDFTKIETNNGTSGDRRAVWNQGCNVDRFSRVIKPFFDANPIFQIFDATQQNDDDEDSALILTLAE